MKLAERHVIKKNSPMYSEIDSWAFKSKNLYNQANYQIRQKFIFERVYLTYPEVDKLLKNSDCYRALPAKVAQAILMKLSLNWQSFFAANAEYNDHPEKFKARPRLPKYKHKSSGRNILIYNSQAISKVELKAGYILPSKMKGVKVYTLQSQVNEVRIVPRYGYYMMEVVHEKEPEFKEVNPQLVAAIDIGVDNLATVTSNLEGFVPILVNGRPLKNLNQYFNKRKAELQKILGSEAATSQQLERMTVNRNFRVDDYLHKSSRYIIDTLVANEIGTLVIGHNNGWKQDVNIGAVNNQNFVQIPFSRFINQLTYKAQLVGINVYVSEESYTSKASFLDGDEIPTYDPQSKVKYKFSGRRIHRGLYRTGKKRLINADVNGSYNILRKAIPNAFSYGTGATVVQPVRVTPAK